MKVVFRGIRKARQTWPRAACLKKQKGSNGDGLRSHTVTSAVSSALVGLTTGFEKGPGVTPPL